MANLFLTASEQREIFRNPEALMVLMAYHDIQQDQADSMGAECHGNKLRYEELKALGKAIVEQDPAIWSNDVLRAFDVVQPSPGYPRTAGVAVRVETALDKFNKNADLLKDETPLERLRYFLSHALNGQDWLDVEPFLDALAAGVAGTLKEQP